MVLNRTRDLTVSLWYEKQGIRVLHTGKLVELGNHKWKTLQYLKEHMSEKELCIPHTIYLHGKNKTERNMDFLFDKMKEITKNRNGSNRREMVLKSVDGHGGNEVLLLSDTMTVKEIQEVWDRFSDRECILQEKIDSDSRDIRVYVLGGQIYAAILRHGTKDFRSNYSLGGEAVLYHLSKQEQKEIECYMEAFKKAGELGMVGVDFILTREGRLVFNELEEMAGSRMLYAHSRFNIVKDYVDYLAE